jgi:hypothetical protein
LTRHQTEEGSYYHQLDGQWNSFASEMAEYLSIGSSSPEGQAIPAMAAIVCIGLVADFPDATTSRSAAGSLRGQEMGKSEIININSLNVSKR